MAPTGKLDPFGQLCCFLITQNLRIEYVCDLFDGHGPLAHAPTSSSKRLDGTCHGAQFSGRFGGAESHEGDASHEIRGLEHHFHIATGPQVVEVVSDLDTGPVRGATEQDAWWLPTRRQTPAGLRLLEQRSERACRDDPRPGPPSLARSCATPPVPQRSCNVDHVAVPAAGVAVQPLVAVGATKMRADGWKGGMIRTDAALRKPR